MICKRRRKNSANTLALALLLASVFMTGQINAKYKFINQFFNTLTSPVSDTIPRKTLLKPADTTVKPLTVPKPRQNTADTGDIKVVTLEDSAAKMQTIDTLQLSSDSLDAPIFFEAEDSGVLVIPTKQFILYGQSNVNYKDIKLEAAVINYEQSKQLISAYGAPDTAQGDPLNLPTLTQEGSISKSDTIFFNTKTQKGLTKNSFYSEGEMFVYAGKIKKVTADVAYGYKNRFTTCNLDTPHFAFRTARMKIINNKFAVSGLTYPEFEGVPMPIGIPFGIFPLMRGRHSGFLPPQFAANDDYGLGLEGMGYYKVMNDNWDVLFRSNIYSYGGWTLQIRPTYMKRYRYSGNFNISIQKVKLLNRDYYSKTTNEFFETNTFFIDWTHARDNRARPGTSFSARVSAGSSKHYQYVPNNAFANYTNQLSSSISWGKTFNDGKSNLTVSANHNQNNILRLQNITPIVNYAVNTFYPFQSKEQVGTEKWYQKLGISYSGSLESRIPFYDTAFNLQRIMDTVQWGATHNPNISLALPPLGPLIFSPSISYGERWYGQRTLYAWNGTSKKVDTTLQKGFYAAREISFGVNASTRIFGTVNFNKDSRVRAIRHEIKPYVSFNYKPDLMAKHYYNVQVDTTGKNFVRLSEFSGQFSTFGEGVFGGMYFGIDNLFEMKVRNKEDTSGVKKVRLIDGLSITSGYNFLADSLQLQPFNINLRSTLFEKINITAGATLDPYQIDTFGRRVNRYTWSNGQLSLGRFTNANIAVSTSLQSKKASDKKDVQTTIDPTLTPDEQQRQLEYIRTNPSEFVDFEIPWTMQLSFTANFTRLLNSDLRSFRTEVSSGLTLNGDFSLTPRWKIGGGTYMDVRTMRIESFTMFISREMHCWQMSINLTPIGYIRSFSISISPKSGMLRDLRINRNRWFYSGI